MLSKLRLNLHRSKLMSPLELERENGLGTPQGKEQGKPRSKEKKGLAAFMKREGERD